MIWSKSSVEKVLQGLGASPVALIQPVLNRKAVECLETGNQATKKKKKKKKM